MFILNDGRKITKDVFEELCEVAEDTSPCEHFLYIEDLTIVSIPHAHRRKLKCFESDKSFISIPRAKEDELRKWMYEYTDFVVHFNPKDAREEKALSEELEGRDLLLKLLNDTSYKIEEIEKELEQFFYYHDGWLISKQQHIGQAIAGWLSDYPIEAKDDPDYWYDDDCCMVCQYMKAVEKGLISSGPEGMMEAMRQQNKKQEF